MRDGLYKVQFQTRMGIGFGVVYARAGNLWGGDAALYYVGKYSLSGNTISAKVETNRHSNAPGAVSVFGVDHVLITLNGTVNGDTVTTSGKAAEAPGISFDATLTRIHD
jgi:hypothetical protein